MLTAKTTADLIDMLTSKIAGNELALAVMNGSVLSDYTMKRLVIAMGDEEVAKNIQAAMLCTKALSVHDIRVMVDAFSNALLAAEFISNVAGGISAPAARQIGFLIPFVPNPIIITNQPKNQSMPTGFLLNVSTAGNTGHQQVRSTLPAGSTFPSTGAGASFLLYNARNTNTYVVWFNVSGGSNTDPTLTGQISVEVTIGAADSAATVAADTQAAIAAASPVGMTATVLGAVVTTVSTSALNQAAAPTSSVPAGTYFSPQLVVLSSLTAGASIYYTTNGSTPTALSTLYTGPITVSATETIKSIAIDTGCFLNSSISSLAFVLPLQGVNLGTAGNYRILAESGITNASSATVVGDIAVSPISYAAMTGWSFTPAVPSGGNTSATSALITGLAFASDYSEPTPTLLTAAVSAKNAAYTDAAGRLPDFTGEGAGELGGLNLTPGVHKWTTPVTISTNVTLTGTSSDIFIMQCASTLDLAVSTQIVLVGVLPQNVFWQVAGAVSLLTSSTFRGIMLGHTSVAVGATQTVHGRLYAGTAVTLISGNVGA